MKYALSAMLMLMCMSVMGQKYFSKSGKITFYSDAPLEKIEAHNTTASTVLDATTGNFEWAVLIKGFQFEKALMQEHFNENYMESDKYPKAVFKGRIDNLSQVNFSKDGEYTVKASGNLEMHGVTQPVMVEGKLKVKGESISASGKFNVKVEDYKIQIPKVVADNIAKVVEVTVSADYQKFDRSQ